MRHLVTSPAFGSLPKFILQPHTGQKKLTSKVFSFIILITFASAFMCPLSAFASLTKKSFSPSSLTFSANSLYILRAFFSASRLRFSVFKIAAKPLLIRRASLSPLVRNCRDPLHSCAIPQPRQQERGPLKDAPAPCTFFLPLLLILPPLWQCQCQS